MGIKSQLSHGCGVSWRRSNHGHYEIYASKSEDLHHSLYIAHYPIHMI